MSDETPKIIERKKAPLTGARRAPRVVYPPAPAEAVGHVDDVRYFRSPLIDTDDDLQSASECAEMERASAAGGA